MGESRINNSSLILAVCSIFQTITQIFYQTSLLEPRLITRPLQKLVAYGFLLRGLLILISSAKTIVSSLTSALAPRDVTHVLEHHEFAYRSSNVPQNRVINGCRMVRIISITNKSQPQPKDFCSIFQGYTPKSFLLYKPPSGSCRLITRPLMEVVAYGFLSKLFPSQTQNEFQKVLRLNKMSSPSIGILYIPG
ncbi:hypothetical protein CEXT_752211 [Caerostris extrusa]|uniref:Uncharacterized protein n=1 Tax=Caerostris extrusa TaxID=172846 RepID=A0AAV4P3H6_CAEEX|nr:hypothetical protein CEXT_752211 [Caerostris extrusa]